MAALNSRAGSDSPSGAGGAAERWGVTAATAGGETAPSDASGAGEGAGAAAAALLVMPVVVPVMMREGGGGGVGGRVAVAEVG